AAALKGKVEADRFVEPTPCLILSEQVSLRPAADTAAAYDTVLLHGEPFDVYENADAGWAWGQSGLDGYVGYVPTSALTPLPERAPTHRVVTLGAQLYAAAALKSPPAGRLPFGARVAVSDVGGDFSRTGNGLWVPNPQIRPLDLPQKSWVAVAETFEGVPYVWGGRSSDGLDCSALVQLALQSAGIDCPRDSDMQAKDLGTALATDAALKRGDLIFWKGHVGIMLTAKTLLHANAHHMAVATEPLQRAVTRIEAAGGGTITRRARLK
ncbi:MAG: NlpC/P60 family protein, partial [Pseudomonadota bacterium]